jgi:hypothetical protein
MFEAVLGDLLIGWSIGMDLCAFSSEPKDNEWFIVIYMRQ